MTTIPVVLILPANNYKWNYPHCEKSVFSIAPTNVHGVPEHCKTDVVVQRQVEPCGRVYQTEHELTATRVLHACP